MSTKERVVVIADKMVGGVMFLFCSRFVSLVFGPTGRGERIRWGLVSLSLSLSSGLSLYF